MGKIKELIGIFKIWKLKINENKLYKEVKINVIEEKMKDDWIFWRLKKKI
jgi:hypothetical protein